jgi:CDGSH-type Zn-finger protein
MEMHMQPTIAQKSPYPVEVEAGESYYWCSCGKSQKQPFCDGSHKGSEFSPVAFTAEKTETKYFCGCKMTANQPFCDGAHAKL